MTDSPSTPESTRQPSPGSDEQLADEKALLRRYARDRSPVVREELAERFMPLARRLASRYAGGAEPFDDLVQVASVGLSRRSTVSTPTRHGLLDLRGPDDPRRAEAPLPRPRVVGPRAPRRPGAHPQGRAGDWRSCPPGSGERRPSPISPSASRSPRSRCSRRCTPRRATTRSHSTRPRCRTARSRRRWGADRRGGHRATTP